MAGAITCSRVIVPYLSSACSRPATVPGTHTAFPPCVAASGSGSASNMSGRAAAMPHSR